MKTIIRTTAFFLFAMISSRGMAQMQICAGNSTLITANNNQNLVNPTYSLNPGGITSSNPTFTVTPSASTTYTIYVTGTNTNAVTVTNSYTLAVYVNSLILTIVNSCSNMLGCNSASVCSITIPSVTTLPFLGGPVTYTFLAPGSSTILPAGALGVGLTQMSVSIPGTWSVVVRDMQNGCTTWSTVSIGSNTTPPTIGAVSVTQTVLTCNTPTTVIQTTPNPALQYYWQLSNIPTTLTSPSIIVSADFSTSPTPSIAALPTLVVTDPISQCQSTTVIPIYQNIYKPNTAISSLMSLGVCQQSVTLTNASQSGIPIGSSFPNSIVLGWLWEGPSPQVTGSLSTTYLAHTSGIYTLTGKDLNNGCIKTATYNVTVGPLAAFAHTVTGAQVAFNDASVGTTGSSNYLWDFGDGTGSTLKNPIHTYISAGAYAVKLTITQPGSVCTSTVAQSVNISGAPCSANSGFLMAPTGTTQYWNVIPSYPWNVTNARWDWGDGSFSNILYTSHQYSAAAMYNICLSVTVACAATSSTCSSYSVYRSAEQTAQILNVNVVSPELQTSISSTTSDEQLSWSIVPNPNSGEFKLDLTNAKTNRLRITITDFMGRILYDQNIDTSAPAPLVQLNDLYSGIYLVSLDIEGKKTTKRMMLNR